MNLDEELHFRRALEASIAVGVATVDLEGVQTYVNPAFCAMVGYEQTELIGARPPFVYWPNEEIGRIQAAFAATIAGKAPPEGFELRFRRRSGARFDSLVTISPLAEPTGRTLGWLATVFDLTDRKETEERLRASESRLRLALEAGRMGAWEWTVGDGKVSWSPELEAIHGLPSGAFPGNFEGFQRDIHPDDRERVLAGIGGALRQGTDYHIQYRILRPDGEVRWLEARGRVQRDASGGPQRMLGVCSDITDRKRLERTQQLLAEAAVLLSSSLDLEENLKALARLVVPRMADWCVIHLVGEDGRLATVETAHRDPEKRAMVLELDRNEPLSPDAPYGPPRVIRTGEASLHRKLTPKALAAIPLTPSHRRLIEELQLHSSMVVPLKARGRTLGTISLVSGESKREFGGSELALAEELASRAALAIDNARLFAEVETARRTTERSASRLRLLAEASELLALSLDQETTMRKLADFAVSSLADYCIVYSLEKDDSIRRAAAAHRKLAKQRLVEELVTIAAPRIDDKLGVGQVIRSGEPLLAGEITEAQLERAITNEEHRALVRRLSPRSSIIVPLTARGRRLGAVALATTDDSERRFGGEDLMLAQELARRAAAALENARLYREAQEAIRARDEMVAVVSHDLRNPLQSILTACQLLELDAPAERRGEFTAILRRSAKEMERLVEDLLDVSRIEAGELSLALDPVQVPGVLSESLALYRPLAANKNVRLEFAVQETLPSIVGDRGRLLQLFSNLIGNAIKFTDGGGRVELSARRGEGEILISISDTGQGISEEELPRIFDRFWQADRKGRQGTGLGLTIAKGIVEAHGGTIEVSSEVGVGSTFFVSLPIAPAERSPVEQMAIREN
jgi:PAS domain S-box-containing protein